MITKYRRLRMSGMCKSLALYFVWRSFINSVFRRIK